MSSDRPPERPVPWSEHRRVVRALVREREKRRELEATVARHAADLDGPPRLRDETHRAHGRLDAMTEADDKAQLLTAWLGGIKGIRGWAAVLTLVVTLCLTAYGCRKELGAIAAEQRRAADAQQVEAAAQQRAAEALEDLAAPTDSLP